MKTYQTGVAIYDLHYPHQNQVLWKNFLRTVKDLKPDIFVFGGDNMNMDAVDHWKAEKGQKRPLEGKRLKKEYEGFQAEILDKVEAILPEHCRKIFLLGNHENWVEQYIDKHPEIEGLLEIRNNLKLENWEVVEYGHTAKAGKLHFHHGEYVSKYSAAKTVETYGRNIVYGHGHTYQTYTKITPIDQESHLACQIPCACDMNPDYMKNRPHAWLNGFAVFYVHSRGYFNLFPVIAPKGHYVLNGKYY